MSDRAVCVGVVWVSMGEGGGDPGEGVSLLDCGCCGSWRWVFGWIGAGQVFNYDVCIIYVNFLVF